jgi:hypothetical protein
MSQRYWLELPNGSRQLIDPARFDLASIVERARRLGGRLVLEVPQGAASEVDHRCLIPAPPVPRTYEPPIDAVGPLFRTRIARIHACRTDYTLDINTRATVRVLGGYYRRRRLVRIYSHDRQTGRRPLEELFDTFLHEMAHHLEYTEPQSFNGRACGRRPGTMHSPLFWRILGTLKHRWTNAQHAEPPLLPPDPAPARRTPRAQQTWLFSLDG